MVYIWQLPVGRQSSLLGDGFFVFSDAHENRHMEAGVRAGSPYTEGDTAVNVGDAFEAVNLLADLSYAWFVPRAKHFRHLVFSRPYEYRLDLDNPFF